MRYPEFANFLGNQRNNHLEELLEKELSATDADLRVAEDGLQIHRLQGRAIFIEELLSEIKHYSKK